MADQNPVPVPMHLERMGRELKCPICLSLFTSAVSIPCNHIFCNECISKSMKSGSLCPVCKVPYTRREIRAAPHMDNLVTIYKNMEIASGLNIHVTQNQPPNRTSDSENEVRTHSNCTGRVVSGAQHDKVDNGRKGKKRRSNGVTQRGGLPDPIPVKPAFPTKKRVQVPHHLSPQSPKQGAEVETRLQGITEGAPQRKKVLKDEYATSDNGELPLSPFFWLREDDEDRPTQNTNEDQMFYITPPELPSFSDLKESDDEGYFMEKVSKNMDSEMFDWTQRACSPELLSSPVKLQAETVDQSKGKKNLGSRDTGMGISCDMSDKCTALTDVTPKKTRNDKTCDQKSRNAKGANHEKKTRRNTKNRCTSHVNEKLIADGVCTTFVSDKTEEIKRNSSFHDCSNEADPVNVSASSYRAFTLQPCNINKVKRVPVVDDEKRTEAEDINLNYGKILRSQARRQDCSRSSRSKKSKPNSFDTAVIEDVNEDTYDIAGDSGKCAKEMKPNLCLKPVEYKRKKELGVSNDVYPKDGLTEEHKLGGKFPLHKEVTDNIQGSIGIQLLHGLSTTKKHQDTNRTTMQANELDNNKIRCAFCLSSEESALSGEMVHYFNGRAVASDYNAGLKIIHSHRNCTEWAPNVYFENDTAINLEAELSRSRRIKCSCCGLKGAALGCYEKSCRKSFHFPCAKSVSTCQWDAENFVMLCPLHASLKLPAENSEKLERRIKSTHKGRSPTQQDQIGPNHSISLSQKGHPCGSFRKLVLCCSALTFEEKEIVCEFEKFSKVTLLKKWDSRATHVIVSTDENGAFRRTLKVLRAILEGKWVLNIEWVKACMKAMTPVDEAPYEVTVDVYGIRDGPRIGRLRLLNKEPKLFHVLRFYIMGDFLPSYKNYLEELILAAGGTILHRKPIAEQQEALSSGYSMVSTHIVYSLELPSTISDPQTKETILSRRQSAALALANSTRAKAVNNNWVLNSIAASKLQGLD